MIVELYIPCEGCGSPTRIPEKSGEINCKICGFEAIYNKEIKYCSFLKFNLGDDKEKLYEISGDIIIGRNRRHQLVIKDPIQKTEEIIPIRIPEVSYNHSKITTSNKYEIKEIDGKKYVVKVLSCSIEDNGSLNGTDVDGQHLKPKTQRVLTHGNKITFAPGERQYLDCEYLIKRTN
jgi:pSer/pThr/pTyr-binding forkhead associated (FHA) protein